MEDLAPFAFCQLCNGNSGPTGDDPGNLILGDAFVYQGKILILNLLLFNSKLILEAGQLAVLELCRFIQVVVLLCHLDLFVHVLDLFAEFGQVLYRCFLIIPLSLLGIKFIPKLCQFLLEISETLTA